MLARQLDPTAGRYEVDGQDVGGLSLEEVRSLFAVVDDEPHLFAGTLRANLLLARPDASDEEVEAALDAAGLAAWRAGLTEGLGPVWARAVSGSAGGSGPGSPSPAPCCGSPASCSSTSRWRTSTTPTAEAVLADLFRSAAGRTVVLVSHRPEGLEGAGRIMDLGAATARAAGA